MADKDKRIDPFDIDALEKSLNDSATRVSTIWVTYLLFGLYLVIAAGNVTHRQLFLEEAIKLPILNIELPLVGFFVLAPILFVTVHCYVLIQIVLLARTAFAYNEAVDHYVKARADNARVRQRLANTLFAQVLAGSSREREGPIGWLLRAMTAVTLTVAPLATLVTCQLKFLPFHSHGGTWGHRVLITFEVVVSILFWLAVREPNRRPADAPPGRSFKHWIFYVPASVAVAAFIVFYGIILSFSGERHASWAPWSIEVTEAEQSVFNFCNNQNILFLFSRYYDRLALPREDFVDDEKLAKIESATRDKRIPEYSGERTRSLRDRDLRCGIFSGVDLRRADLAGADTRGARFDDAELQGTNFEKANLEGTSFVGARLQRANFNEAKAQGSNFSAARMQGASFSLTQLQGADFIFAGLQNSLFDNTQLQAARMTFANLQEASFMTSKLEGADLSWSKLQGAMFFQSRLPGANLSRAELAGASFENSPLSLAKFSESRLWRANVSSCEGAQLTDAVFDGTIASSSEMDDEVREGDTDGIDRFIEGAAAGIPQDQQGDFKKYLREKLVGERRRQEAMTAEVAWRACASHALPPDHYERELAKLVGGFACFQHPYQYDIALGIHRNWTEEPDLGANFKRLFARRLLGLDGEACPKIADYLSDNAMDALRTLAEGDPK